MGLGSPWPPCGDGAPREPEAGLRIYFRSSKLRQHSFNTNHVYTFNIPHNFLIGELHLFLASLLPSNTTPSKDANLVKGQTARLQQETPSRQAEGTHPPRHTPPILHHLQHTDPFTRSTTGAFCSLALRNTYTPTQHLFSFHFLHALISPLFKMQTRG